LPQYAAQPRSTGIINGETKTGVTTFLLDHEIDYRENYFIKRKLKSATNDTVAKFTSN
jgi:methionyl-tRNA formyltransferase